MEEHFVTLEGHVPNIKEVVRYIILSLPGQAIGMMVLSIAVLYVLWSSLKSGVYYSRQMGFRNSFKKGFYKSVFPTVPTSITRAVYICAIVSALLICIFRGIAGFIYQAL